MTYITAGRCRSGKRWFWIAVLLYDEAEHKCDDPVCVYGGPHRYGWEDTEELALKAMDEAVAQFTDGTNPDRHHGSQRRAGMATSALKRVNAAKRRARPPSGETATKAIEYLYAPWSWSDDYGETHKGITEIPIVRKTPKRIYFDASDRWDRSDGIVTLGYIGRTELEDDTRCPGAGPGQVRCGHGHYGSHGYPRGEMWYHGSARDVERLFTTREAAEEYLYRWEREQARKREERGPELKRLKQEMADAHPDRGGTDEEFMAARQRYKQALREAS